MSADPCSPYCPFRGCSTCDYQGGNMPVEEPVDSPTFPHHNGRIKAQHKSGPGGASTPLLLGLTPDKEGLMGSLPNPPTPADQIALIRSLTGHAEGREETVLEQVRRVLNGATLEQLAAEVSP